MPDKTFDQEIREDIIPNFSPESELYLLPNLDIPHTLLPSVQRNWFGYNPHADKGREFGETPIQVDV
jgi:hypothetical protein